jgi:hypothetical protein
MVISSDDYWTSGSDLNCSNKFFWCSKEAEFIKTQVSWKAGHPDANAGDCVHAEVRKSVTNETLLAASNCSRKLYYVCETRHKGTEFKGLTIECMSLWDVSEGLPTVKLLIFIDSHFYLLLAEVEILLLNGYNTSFSHRIKVYILP